MEPRQLDLSFGPAAGDRLRGGDAIAELYDRVFAGSETGGYTVDGSSVVPLSIRTSRYFRYDSGRWVQLHHYGSVDDASAPVAYQSAVRG